MIKLRDILERPDRFPWEDALYSRKEDNPSLDSECLVLARDPNDPAQPREDALQRGFQYTLAVDQVQDIVENARAQKADASPDDLLRAFVYYCKHDAFIPAL